MNENTAQLAAPQPLPVHAFDPRPDLSAAIALAGRTLAAVRPDQYDLPTPCAEFDVRRLSSHLVAVLRRIAVIGRGEDPFSVPSFADELSDGAWAAAWAPATVEAEAVWADDSILTRELRLPIGPKPGAVGAVIYTNELTVHTWDLARATGQQPVWDPALVERVLEVLRRSLPAGRRGGPVPYAEVVAVDDDAPAIDRLVAWTGRRP
ncbi:MULTISPECIES: TIGR03086 family metal-binding protein [unclassified Streptomyces]|uniref:TIGR03086 family metal-binding protein n=1 Tax=unclassified Streptomyces TaxID=2593676 RepID=UPI002E2FD76E|nr:MULTISPECIES: TIGR03086 family metal-binding protein [unclassified Streptomyces]WUC67737.1 TIGR03086 family metal-binding protein [Streptomyces sp. NBC_00539]